MLSIVDCICHVVGSFLFKQKTAYEMRIGDWSSDVCSSDLLVPGDSEGYIGGGRRTVNTQICHPSIFFPTSSEGLSGSRDQRIPSALSSACTPAGRSWRPAPPAAKQPAGSARSRSARPWTGGGGGDAPPPFPAPSTRRGRRAQTGQQPGGKGV